MASKALSASQAERLRAAFKSGDPAPVLAERFGITRRTVYRYVTGLAKAPKRLTPEQRRLAATLPGSERGVAQRVGCVPWTVRKLRAKANAC